MAHITGGGIPGNLNRVLGATDAIVDAGAWQIPPLFRMLVERGGLEREEAFKAFNMGIGMVLVVEAKDEEHVVAELEGQGEQVFRLGRTVAGSGRVELTW